MSTTLKHSKSSKVLLCKAIAQAFPSYRKRSISWEKAEAVEPLGYWWDGGSKTDYHTCTTAGFNCKRAPVPNGPPQFTKGKLAEPIALTPGMMVVTTGTFCGKTATLHVYIHPEDVERLTCDPSECDACEPRAESTGRGHTCPVDSDTIIAAIKSDDYLGFCLECGDEAHGVEPDAREYKCESCGAKKVYGAEELLIMGHAG